MRLFDGGDLLRGGLVTRFLEGRFCMIISVRFAVIIFVVVYTSQQDYSSHTTPSELLNSIDGKLMS